MPPPVASLRHGGIKTGDTMTTEQTSITGAEYRGKAETPREALAQFYAAFNAADLAGLAESWDDRDDVSMDNPIGGIVRGWPEVRAVSERLVAGPARVRVEFYDYSLHEAGDLCYAVGRERGTVTRDARELALAIRTTRLFRRRDGRWRQVHHHGSINTPELLQAYQTLVRGPTTPR
jgi:ketosteroid isomerase-like protein